MVSYGYYVFGKDMNNLNLKSLHNQGVSDLFLNFYSISLYGNSKVESFIKNCENNGINVHLWVQSFYDGGWINPKKTDLTNKINEIKKYSKLKGVYGIHLDYLRYPGDAYKTSGGADAITKFVKDVKKSIPSNIKLSCAIMPEKEGKQYYGQDIVALGKIVDFVIPMQYKGNYSAGSEWLKSTTTYFCKYANVWSGLQSYKSDDNPAVLSSSELSEDVKICKNNGAKGVILFRYGLSPSNFKFVTTTNSSVSKNSKTVNLNIIKKLASIIKNYVETNHKFPTSVTLDNVKYSYGELAYIFSYEINHMGKGMSYATIKNSVSSTGDKFKENILEDDYKDMSKRVYNYINKNNTCPNYVTTMKSKKKVRPRDFIYMMARIIVYYYNHNKVYPKYASINTNIWG